MLGNPQVGAWSGPLFPLLYVPVLFVFVFLLHFCLSLPSCLSYGFLLVGAFAWMLVVFNLNNLQH